MLNLPPTYSRFLSGDSATTFPSPLIEGANGSRLPVVMSYASRLERGVRLVPAAAPAGRVLVNEPPAYTVLPATACDHTTPLSSCTVGSGSDVTVAAERSWT